MKEKIISLMVVCTILLGTLAGCAAKPDTNVLYVNLTWHQHQPLYYKNADGVYTRPWVRVHATKDYLDMAETVAKYEGLQATFNLTPSLIRQLDDYANNGAKDLYWVYAEIPASELTKETKTFILERFFDANWDHVIARFPRYQELLDKRGGEDEAAIAGALETFTEQDYRDLQIWFNLAWVDPDYLEQEPFKALVEKGRDFSEGDKPVLFNGILEIIRKVIPYHKELQDQGIIEVTTTPYAHPILPLIYNSDLALMGNPKAIMPDETFSYPQDAETQLANSAEMYQKHFGREVRGLWPGEGAVAEDIVGLVSEAGYTFMQTGEPVLAKSLGMESFTRDASEKVTQPDDLYRPYYVQGEAEAQVGVFFRDWNLSDKIGFTYSGMAGKAAATDLVGRLEAIQADFASSGSTDPHIVTIVVDGENAWENYDNDGKEFLNSLYEMLSTSETLKTITPSAYLELFPEQRTLETLFPGAWFSANYDTWIGEDEEAIAWNLLGKVRTFLAEYEDGSKTADPQALATAFDYMYLAEGSDWFWWYGSDQDSGQDSYFDQGYRELLKQVYISLGAEVPAFLDVPVIQPAPIQANQPLMKPGSPEIDGKIKDEAWEWAAYYQGSETDPFDGVYYTLDEQNLSLRIDLKKELTEDQSVELYLGIPGETERLSWEMQGNNMLVIPASRALQITSADQTLDLFQVENESWIPTEENLGRVAVEGKYLEAQIPIEYLGGVKSGDTVPFTVVLQPEDLSFPAGAPASIQILSLGPATQILLVEDLQGDDNGPGTYTYPTDAVFKTSDFDLKSVEISTDSANLSFIFSLVGEISNGWSSPNGFSVQTFDVYIDEDPGAGTGERMLLPGRNAALGAENGWEVAIWVEGWTPQVVVPDKAGEGNPPVNYTEASSAMKVYVDVGKNAVVAVVPLEYFGEGDPTTWGYTITLLGQEGYPAEEVWRVRDVGQQAEQYRFGGAPADNNHTRIIDVALAEGSSPSQAEVLGTYPSTAKLINGLGPDDFAILPVIIPTGQ